MKSSILRNLVVTLGMSAVFGPAALMAQGEIRVTIPFDFTVGAKLLPAGNYTVQKVMDNFFSIRGGQTHSAVMASTNPGQEATKAGIAMLTFKKYGDSYFLSMVSDGSRSWELPSSSAERLEIAKRASPKRVAVATTSASK